MKHAMFLLLASFNNLAGDNSKEATPDPIPNSVVKLFRVDGTAWVTVWESRSLPAFFCFCAVNSASAALSPSVTYRVPGVTLRSPRAVTLRPFRALVVAPLRGAFFVFDVRHCVGCVVAVGHVRECAPFRLRLASLKSLAQKQKT